MLKEEKKVSKVKENKRRKEEELFTAAYELFTTKGTKNTAIDEIVKKAGVAKGTFYLYFKDKYDIINKLILRKSVQIIKDAMKKTEEEKIEAFEDQTIFFIDYLINYFKTNKLLLKLINKNFSCGLYKRTMLGSSDESHKEVQEIMQNFMDNLQSKYNMSLKEAESTLFMIFELVGGVCYSSIVLGEPEDIDTIKPILFKKILAMMRN